jgi:hypothetical protein
MMLNPPTAASHLEPASMKSFAVALLMLLVTSRAIAADNVLSDAERKDGWLLLFDGNSLAGWTTSSQKPSQRPVE